MPLSKDEFDKLVEYRDRIDAIMRAIDGDPAPQLTAFEVAKLQQEFKALKAEMEQDRKGHSTFNQIVNEALCEFSSTRWDSHPQSNWGSGLCRALIDLDHAIRAQDGLYDTPDYQTPH